MHPFLDVDGPVVFAHRGAHGHGAGENAFEAFAAAVALGCTHLETDVHVTRDGVVVALHDHTLDRTTDGHGRVADRTWEEVAGLTVTGGGRVPRLDELLATWPHVRWNLDCKHPATAPHLAATLRAARVLDRVCVGSFEHATVRRLRQALGRGLCTAATSREVRLLVAASRLPRPVRAVPSTLVRADCVQVPLDTGRSRVVTARFVATCRQVGLPVHVWTVDEPRTVQELLDLGVAGLFTDDPAVVLQVLEGRRRAGPPS